MAINTGKASDNPLPSQLFAVQGSDPATPETSHGRLYAKTDGLYFIDDVGTITGPYGIGGGGGGGYTEGARVYNDANISIANSTNTPLTFNTERYDTDGIHSVASNTGRLTCQSSGKYIIAANVSFAANANGFRRVYMLLNGVTTIADQTIPNAGTSASRLSLTTIYDLSSTDYIELFVWQSSGGALNVVSSGNYSPEFMMQRIG